MRPCCRSRFGLMWALPLPVLAWYPPESWPVGETVRLQFNTVPWHTRETGAYRLGFGLVDDSDVWHMAGRQPPSVRDAAEFALRLPADGSLIELARIEQPWAMPIGEST